MTRSFILQIQLNSIFAPWHFPFKRDLRSEVIRDGIDIVFVNDAINDKNFIIKYVIFNI